MSAIRSNPTTLVELVTQRSATMPERTAFTFLLDGEHAQQHLSYAALAIQARTVAAWLQQQHVGHEPVLILCPTGPEFIAAFFGCLFAGAIAVPLPTTAGRRSLPQVAAIAQHTKASVVLTSAATAAVCASQPALQHLNGQVVAQLDPALAATWQPQPINPTTTALLQYTSGSTAAPKGVMLSQRNLLANVAQISQRYALTSSAVSVFWLPLYHDMGLISSILAPIYVACRAILLPPAAFAEQPLRWLQAISQYQATISSAPDMAYRLCVERSKAEERSQLDLSAWRVAICGAEPVRSTTLARFASAFAAAGFRAEYFCPAYGLAEATLMVTARPDRSAPRTLMLDRQQLAQGQVIPVTAGGQTFVSCGLPVADCEVAIVAPELQVRVAEQQLGEIWVRGPNVAAGYWNAPQASTETFGVTLTTGEAGFLRTGDLGFLHAGELFIVGRMKDLLIVNGENYFPEDLEQHVAAAHEAALEGVAIFAVDTGEREQIVLLLERRRVWYQATLAEQRRALADSAQRTVAQATGLWVDAVGLVAPGHLPRTTSGKIQRFRCREHFLAAQTAGIELFVYAQPAQTPVSLAAQLQAATPATSFILTFLAQRLQCQIAALDLHQSLRDLGLGSLDAAMLRAQLAERFGIQVPLAWFLENLRLEEFLARVNTR